MFILGQKEDLILRADSTFVFNTYAGAKCSGTWKYVSKDEILIKCFEPENFIEKLAKTYPNPDIIKFKVINENKLKMSIEGNVKRDHVILKRVE